MHEFRNQSVMLLLMKYLVEELAVVPFAPENEQGRRIPHLCHCYCPECIVIFYFIMNAYIFEMLRKNAASFLMQWIHLRLQMKSKGRLSVMLFD